MEEEPEDHSKFDLKLTSNNKANYAFGCKKEDVIATLEDLVARIRDSKLSVQEMDLTHGISFDDYAMKTLRVKVAEPLRPAENG